MKTILLIAIIMIAIFIGSCHIGNSPTGTIDTTYNNQEP